MTALRRFGADRPPALLRPHLPPESRLRADLASAERSMALRPYGWPRFESLARARRVLGQPGWPELLREAVSSVRAGVRDDGEDHLHVANLLLLLGGVGTLAASTKITDAR